LMRATLRMDSLKANHGINNNDDYDDGFKAYSWWE
jgi:hypothetical protein